MASGSACSYHLTIHLMMLQDCKTLEACKE